MAMDMESTVERTRKPRGMLILILLFLVAVAGAIYLSVELSSTKDDLAKAEKKATTQRTAVATANGEIQELNTEVRSLENAVQDAEAKAGTPPECVEALDAADQMRDLAAKTTESYARLSQNASDFAGATLNDDFAALSGVLTDLEDIQADYKRDLAPLTSVLAEFETKSASCRSQL